jgi:hypothetical protein
VQSIASVITLCKPFADQDNALFEVTSGLINTVLPSGILKMKAVSFYEYVMATL